MKRLDPRKLSQEAFHALTELKEKLDDTYHKRASAQVRNLSSYISTWGLHRLSGDAIKFRNGTSEDTRYKGKVYQKFLEKLQGLSLQEFTPDNPSTLIKMHLQEYTSLNRLAIELAKEWSFWTAAVLGEPEEEA
jgi:hypothetical protein